MFAEAAYTAAEIGDRGAASRHLQAAVGEARLMAVALRDQTLDLPPEKRARHAALKIEIHEQKRLAETTRGVEGARALQQLSEFWRELGE